MGGIDKSGDFREQIAMGGKRPLTGGSMETKRVVRLIVYEGPADQVDTQLARSIPDGQRVGGGSVKISSLTLDEWVVPWVERLYYGPDDGQGQIKARLEALPEAPFVTDRQLVMDRAQTALALDTLVHQLTPGQRYLIAVDRVTMPEHLARHLSRALIDMGIKVLLVRTNGDPHEAIKVVDLEKPDAPV